MIGIDKIQTIKTDMSVVVVCNTENINSLREGVLSKQQLEYIRAEFENNAIKEFSFNDLGRYIFVRIVEQTGIDYKDKEKYRRLGAKMLEECDKKYIKDLQLITPIDKEMILGFVEGMLLASYVFDRYKTDPKRLLHPFDNLHICDKDITMQDIEPLRIICEATEKCRDMVNEPVTVINATTLAETIRNMGQEAGMQVEIWDKAKIEKEKMGGILAVNKGSVEPPTFTIMEYKPQTYETSRPIVLVGKGIVYDTGGLNIKTGNYMDDMKSDMAGAALMASVMYACARLNLPIHIIGLFPATDNRPGLNAYASGDIVNMYDGTNVEVVNTDAEGRMILADALAFAKQYDPSLVIDAATLTGAASRAIGPFGIAAIEEKAESFMEILKTCGKRVYERIAEFPFWEEYDNCIKSEIADIKNSGESYAGMITAGKFLAYFTNYPFIHLDIAGVAFTNKKDAYNRLFATGCGVRLLVEFIKTYHK